MTDNKATTAPDPLLPFYRGENEIRKKDLILKRRTLNYILMQLTSSYNATPASTSKEIG